MTTETVAGHFGPSASPLPSASSWSNANKLEVRARDGSKTTLSSLVAPDAETDTVLIIFIRHFFCGLCQDYIRSLSPLITAATLKAQRARAIIVGCGSINLIDSYLEATNTEFPIYCDPTRAMYKELEMTRTLQQAAQKPEYVKTGFVEMTIKALRYGIHSVMKGNGLWEAGDIAQIGGEWIVKDGRLEWCHRMINTADHMGVEDLWGVITFDKAKTETKTPVTTEALFTKTHADGPPVPDGVPTPIMTA